MTKDAAEKLLQKYDVIAVPLFDNFIEHDNIGGVYNNEIMQIIDSILKKSIVKNFPDYVEMFDKVMHSRFFYKCCMFVTRKNILDAYCKWLFSFIIDVAKEYVKLLPSTDLSATIKRLPGFFGEIMLTVWLLKNRLRIKELDIMQVPNL